MIEKRLIWDECKSDVVFVENKDSERLGYLRYERVGAHMHWCWYQLCDIRMSPGCLQEVRDKQKELINLVRKEQKHKDRIKRQRVRFNGKGRKKQKIIGNIEECG